jgi:hypothetical protein
MASRRRAPVVQRLRFRKVIRAPLGFVYRWCTDYRDDDDTITDSIYHYRAKILLRERGRVVRLITVPGKNRNRCTDVEVIRLRPPNRWRLTKMSVTDDESGTYQLSEKGPHVTILDMRFRRSWKTGRRPDLNNYRALFNRVWDEYVLAIEADYRRRGRRRHTTIS